MLHPLTSDPTRSDGTAVRLSRFRHELHLLGHDPSREDLARVLDLARTLNLPSEHIREEMAEIAAALETLDFADHVHRHGLPDATPHQGLPDGERCHQVVAVRFGRRRTDQFGHMELTSGWLKFHGARDVTVAWSEVESVHRAGREIVVSLHDSRRMLRLGCHSLNEAVRGTVIARRLTELAHPEAAEAVRSHAAV